MGQIILWAVGLAAQLVGVFIALVGVFATQRDYKEQDEPWMLDWVFSIGSWIAHSYVEARDWVRYTILRRPRANPKLRVGGMGASGSGVLAPTVQVTDGPLSDELSVEEKLAVLESRSRRDNEALKRIERELIAERQRIGNTFAELDARTVELKAHTSASIRAYATRGIKASALGLFLTAAGMLCSALAQPPMMH